MQVTETSFSNPLYNSVNADGELATDHLELADVTVEESEDSTSLREYKGYSRFSCSGKKKKIIIIASICVVLVIVAILLTYFGTREFKLLLLLVRFITYCMLGLVTSFCILIYIY